MKTTYLTIVLLSLAMSPAGAQQIDGRDCWPAYKKLSQHVTGGVCREKSGEEKGGSVAVHEVPERAAGKSPARK